nr:MAG TPA: hypothetical protein [Caudoviricetes sp.]
MRKTTIIFLFLYPTVALLNKFFTAIHAKISFNNRMPAKRTYGCCSFPHI